MLVYTANIGDYDSDCLINVSHDYWTLYQDLKLDGLSDVKAARKHKIKFWIASNQEDEVLIWLDSNISIHCDLKKFTKKHLKTADMVLMEHGRDCIYEEAVACIDRKKDNPLIISSQMGRYRLQNYPAHNGMVGTGIMIRRNNHKVRKLMELWWSEVEKGSHRDQLSFNFVLWKYQQRCQDDLGEIKINYIPYSVFGKEFKLHPHKK